MNSFGTDDNIRDVVLKYSTTLYRIAFTTLHSGADAEDVVQDVFLRLIEKRPQFASEEHRKAWLIRVAINLARNRLRHSSRKELPIDVCMELAAANDCECSFELLPAVLSLPEKYSTIIHLYYYEDYSISEIAHILSLPSATVGTRLARGRAMLRKSLEGGSFND